MVARTARMAAGFDHTGSQAGRARRVGEAGAGLVPTVADVLVTGRG